MTKNRDTIRSLSEREQAREKVSIWFGSNENYIHPFKEILLNAIDEISNNFDNGKVTIELSDDMKCMTVTDTGRGLPIEGETDGQDNFFLLLLKLFAGTNYDNNEYGKITTGTNGVGLTVTNYCSKYLHVSAYRPDGAYTITFENGGNIVKPLTKVSPGSSEHGTIIRFELDEQVFTNVTYNLEEIKDIVKNTSGVCQKINFEIEYKNEKFLFHYDSFLEYFEDVSENRTCKTAIGPSKTYETIVKKLIRAPGPYNEAEYADVPETTIIQCMIATSSEPIQRSFLNVTYLSEGGTINRGIVYGVRDFVNKYIKDKKLIDKKLGEVSHIDIEDSISFACNVLSTNVEFANQTKLSTNKNLYMRIAKEYIQEVLDIYKIEKPKELEKFVNHILEVQKNSSKAQAAKAALKKKLTEKVDNILNRIVGLVDSKFHGPLAELFIAEGNSAAGSIIDARDPKYQAVIAIRGKILNILKSGYDEIFKSDIIINIIKALGCGIETDKRNKDIGEFVKEALRYGKIIIAADADPDGYQIVCLVLTVFYRLMPTLIKDGHVYIALTPLFEIKDLKTKKFYYAFTDEEKDKIVSELGKCEVSRNKGLGEVDADVLARTGVDPETRKILQVTYDDAEKMAKAFKDWMDHDVTNRKIYIENDLNKYEAE